MSEAPNHKGYVPVLLDPIADAKPVEAKSMKDLEVNKKRDANTKNLRIVAPMAMGAGSSLYVECDGSTYLVKIPQGGVEAGDTFEAPGHRKTPITGGWRDGLFDCCQASEGNFCATVWCVPIIAFGCLMEPLKMDCFYRRNSSIPQKAVFGFMCVLCLVFTILHVNLRLTAQQAQLQQSHTTTTYGSPYNSGTYNSGGQWSGQPTPEPMIPPIFTNMMLWYIISLLVTVRVFARLKYKIPGNCCLDCLSVYFCTCCSALQIFRHMKASGDEPRWTRMTQHTEATLADNEEDTVVLEAKASVIDEESVPVGKEASF